MTLIRSEDMLLGIIDEFFPREHRNLALGRGDDAAELNCPPLLALSTDLFVEDVHFRSRYFSPEELGRKALAVNLSDLAAAGAVPRGFSLGLMTPRDFSAEYAKGVMSGMAGLALAFDLPLSGGDISTGPKLGFCISVWGAPASLPGGELCSFLRRNPPQAGDSIFLVGQPEFRAGLGLAGVGRLALEALGREAINSYPAACTAHLNPLPLVEQGQALARINMLAAVGQGRRWGLGVMDVSDGLLRDLPRLLAGSDARRQQGPKGHLGADLDMPVQSLHPEILDFAACEAEKGGGAPEPLALALALQGGEDYCLLGVCPQPLVQDLRKSLPEAILIGEVTDQAGIRCNGEPISGLAPGGGFDHYNAAPAAD